MQTDQNKQPEHIFVYGILKKAGGAGDMMSGSEFVSDAKVKGDLYNLGSYPGLRHGDGVVTGEVYKIKDECLLNQLDRWEGYHKDKPEYSMYLREQVDLIEPKGVRAWVYVYNRDVHPNHKIKDGCWIS